MIRASTPIISLFANKARLLHLQSFAKLSQLILKFTYTLQDKWISISDIEKYFCLPPTLANYIFTNLLSEEYLISPVFSKNESKISAKINLLKYSNFETIPSEESIRPIAYNISKFPRFYVPNYLLLEKKPQTQLKKSSFPSDLDLGSPDLLVQKDSFGIPENFIQLEEDSINFSSESGCDATISIYPQDEGSDSTVLLKRSPLEFKSILIDANHPDYQRIIQKFSNLDLQQILEKYFHSIIPALHFNIYFDKNGPAWTIKIMDLEIKQSKTFFETLESKMEALFARKRAKSLRIALPGFESEFKKVTLVCRFQFEFEPALTKVVFYEYLARDFAKFDDDLDRFEEYLEEVHKKFLRTFKNAQDFPVPKLGEIRDYFWNTQQYQIAYCIMALGDF